MAYVTNLDIVSATSEGLIVAAQASVPEASAATVTVLNGGTASNCVVSTGGGLRTWAADGTGLLDTVTVYDGTLFVRSAGNTGRNLTFSGGIGYLQDGATMTDVNIHGGTLSAYTGTLENAKLYGGNLYAIFDSTGMVFSNTTVYGGTFIVRKLNNSAVDVTLSGGVAHLQSATMTNVGVYNGAELILESGWLDRATVYAGGKITGNPNNIGTVNFNDLTVKAGGSATLTYNFLLTGETNIEEGAYIYLGNTNNPVPGVTAKDGVINNFSTLINGSFGSGVTLTNLRVTGGTTNINSGAVVDGGTLVNGNLRALDAAGGGMIRGVTMSAGEFIVRNAGNSAVDFTLSNGNAYVQNGAVMTDTNIYGGTMNVWSGGTLSNTNLHNGNLQAITADGTGLLDTVTVYDGTLFVRSAGNTGRNLTFSGGIGYLQDGATMTDVNIHGGTLSAYTGTLENAKLYGGNLYAIFDSTGMIFSNTTVYGGNFIFRKTNNSAFDVTLSGGLTYLQEGATMTDVGVNNGATFYAVAGTVNGLTVNAGGQIAYNAYFPTSSIVINDLDVRADAGVNLNGTAVVNRANFAGVDGNSFYVSSGVTINSANLTGGELWVWDARGGALLNGVTVSGGSMILRHAGNSAVNVVMSGGTGYVQGGAYYNGLDIRGGLFNGFAGTVKNARVYGGGIEAIAPADDMVFSSTTVYGGSMIVRSAGRSAVDLTVSGGKAYIQTGAYGSGVTVSSGGQFFMWTNAEADSVTILDGGYGEFREAAVLRDLVVDAPNTDFSGRAYLHDVTVSKARFNGKDNITLVYLDSGTVADDVLVSGGSIFLSSGGTITNLEQTGGAVILRGEQTYISGATVTGGNLYLQNGGDGDAITVAGGGLSAYDTDFTNPAGKTEVVNHVTMTDGRIYVGSGATMTDVNATGGTVEVRNGGTINAAAGNTLNDLQTVAGAKVALVKGAILTGSDTNIAEGTLYFGDAAVAGHATNGVLEGLTIGNAQFSIGNGIIAANAVLNNGSARLSAYEGAVISGTTVTNGAIICVDGAHTRVYDTTLSGTGTCNLNLSAGAQASGTTVGSGAKIQIFNANVSIEDTVIKAGGSMNLAVDGIDTGKLVTLDFSGTTGNQTVHITNLSKVKAETEIVLKGETAGNTYTIADTGSTEKVVNCGDWGLYDDSIKAGETITNAFTSKTYAFDATGTAIEVTEFTAATQATAGSIAGGTTIGDNGKAAKWTGNTTAEAGATYHAATGDFSGEAWLEIDGTNLANTTLFGADATYNGTVNLYATNGAVVNNLAAGAASNGTVAGVKLTLEDATVGLAYAGGFGTVANAAETLIEAGTFQKDFYAGALANYAKTGHATQVGSVNLTVKDGEFSGNIYGASSVKAGAATSLVHSVGNVTITVKDGETKKGNQACLFAGGYATGSVASDSAVYTVGNIDVTVDGGSWGTAAGGRGVFGGIFASKVTAEAQDVTITISGGTMGNVYGGGWAQKGGTSVVGDVVINIDGGTIANVFGGGTHSTSGGSTTAASVSINVGGGDITGDIYAGGQGVGDNVTGEISVTFTGDTNFACGVYGYSYDGGATGDAELYFTAYAGTFSGAIGGFASITLDDDTAMTLSTAAADVSNGAWAFDLTDRADTLAGTSLLTWSGANFENDTVKVNFTDATQAAAGWNIATATFDATTTFTLAIGGTDVTTVAYDTAIADGDWAGWKFTDDNGVLKFKQLA